MSIVICGAGIAGLTLARVCQHLNLPFRILEAAPRLRLEGAGIQISPNAMKVLDKLGLGPAIMAIGHTPTRGQVCAATTGKILLEFPLGSHAEMRFGSAYRQIQRGKLVELLADGLHIEFGHKVEHISDTSEAYAIGGSWGTSFAEILVGADGIHSQVRATLFAPAPPRFTGYLAWRGVIPTSALRQTVTENARVMVGKTGHVVTYKIDPNTLNFVGIVKSKHALEESWTLSGTKDDALNELSEFGVDIAEIVQAAPEINKWGLFDRPALKTFHHRNAAIMGDAAHPILPFLAQGGAMGIEDAWVLGHCLKHPEASLDLYSKLRTERVKRVQAASRNQSHIYHLANPIKKLGFETGMRLTHALAPDMALKRLDWIYGHDVTAPSYIERATHSLR